LFEKLIRKAMPSEKQAGCAREVELGRSPRTANRRGLCRPDGSPSAALPTTGTLGQMNGLWLSLLFGAPWLAAIVWTWSRAPRADSVPPSMGERARQRLWTI
jgi:hypothetical protein